MSFRAPSAGVSEVLRQVTLCLPPRAQLCLRSLGLLCEDGCTNTTWIAITKFICVFVFYQFSTALNDTKMTKFLKIQWRSGTPRMPLSGWHSFPGFYPCNWIISPRSHGADQKPPTCSEKSAHVPLCKWLLGKIESSCWSPLARKVLASADTSGISSLPLRGSCHGWSHFTDLRN